MLGIVIQDSYLIRQINRCPRPDKSVLTTYPPGYLLPNSIPDNIEGILLVPWKFDSNNMLRQKGRRLKPCSNEDQNVNDNIPCLLFAAGFNFSYSTMMEECPYDLNLHNLFFGEEISLALRLYTCGYDLFAPPETVCFHLWSRDHRKTFQDEIGTFGLEKGDNSDKSQSQWHQISRAKSIAKIKDQIAGVDKTSIGSVRTVMEFATRLGVDFNNGVILPGAERGCLKEVDFVSTGISENLFPKGKIRKDDQDELLSHILEFVGK